MTQTSDSLPPETPKGSVFLHFDTLTPAQMTQITEILGGDAVIDTDTARLAGATFAFGSPDALDSLKARLLPDARSRVATDFPDLPAGAAEWLATGEQGLSSKTIFFHLSGHRPPGSGAWRLDHHPHDPADLRRCRLLLDAVPDFAARLPEMAEVSPAWAALVPRWAAICAQMDAEAPEWRAGKPGTACPRTYDMIKDAVGV